ncbi:RDD family protein [Rhodovulum sp. ES.010]|uniref:RDD family protein n=1 Tax=Rhodovulum sp. ES.010 TaxID=1882821 RepID=UPI000925E236|nr:RDD family protein [Rhodovulum sp. ES.010]SIO13351.1 RDD family protein [Rhodovulum sp. ES.010]
MTDQTDRHWGLPDPDLHAAFYDGIPTKRLVAWVVDTVIVILLALLALPFTAFAAVLFLPFFAAIVGFAYRTVTLARGSATWGMRLVAIEIRNGRGERLDTGTAALHTLIYSVSAAFVIPQVVSIVLMLTGPRAQGLHDLMLGTAAINRPAQA